MLLSQAPGLAFEPVMLTALLEALAAEEKLQAAMLSQGAQSAVLPRLRQVRCHSLFTALGCGKGAACCNFRFVCTVIVPGSGAAAKARVHIISSGVPTELHPQAYDGCCQVMCFVSQS